MSVLFLTAARRHPCRRASRRASVLLAVHTLGLGACYGYAAPPSGAPPRAGADVHVALTDAGSVQLASVLGPRVESVEGSLVQAGADSVVLRAARTIAYDGRESTWNGERVAVPAGAVVSVRTRQLDRTRTVLATVAGLGLLVGSAIAFRGKADSGDSRVAGGPPPNTQ